MAYDVEAIDQVRDAFLLTWNPRRWAWDDLERLSRQTAEGKSVLMDWSCGRRTDLPAGSRIFLLRQGLEPKGIVGAGITVSPPYEAPHWDPERRRKGDTAMTVDILFERLLNPGVDEPLPVSRLKAGRLAGVNWNTQMSGIAIGDAAEDLEQVWQKHLGHPDEAYGVEPSAIEGEIRLALRRHRARERWLRDVKLAAYKKANGGRLPCEVCGFDFFEAYGNIGEGFAEVHHRKPLSDPTRPSETKLSDLAVLCANSHTMVHLGAENRPLTGLLKRGS